MAEQVRSWMLALLAAPYICQLRLLACRLAIYAGKEKATDYTIQHASLLLESMIMVMHRAPVAVRVSMNRRAPVFLAVLVPVSDPAYHPVLMSSGSFAYCSSLKHHGDSFRPFLLGLMICEVRLPMTG